jgi:LysM repeat protein
MRIRAGLISVMLVMMVAGCGGGPPPTASLGPGGSVEPTLPIETAVPSEVTPEPTSEEVTPEPEVTPEATDEPGYTTYVVKKGDTLYAIAKKNGTTLKALMDANPEVTDPKKLRVGQKLKIPQ